jgi:hypothetical protein
VRQYIQEPYLDGYQPWTGPGYMLVREGDSLEFNVSDIEFPTNYDIVIRYDLRVGNSLLVLLIVMKIFVKISKYLY